MALAAGTTVYRYQFTKENHFHGTYHAGEMIYAYGNVKKCKEKWKYDDMDLKLSKQMLAYWSNFVKRGLPSYDPDSKDLLPSWPCYSDALGNKTIMELGVCVAPFEDRYEAVYPIIEEYIEKQLQK